MIAETEVNPLLIGVGVILGAIGVGIFFILLSAAVEGQDSFLYKLVSKLKEKNNNNKL